MDTSSVTSYSYRRPRVRGLLIIAGLFVFGLIATWLLDYIQADLAWSGAFYRSGGPNEGWVDGRRFPWDTLYDYGEYLTWLLVAAALVLYILPWFGKVAAYHRTPCLAVMLTVALGPGLLVNGVLKEYWGRPRPAEITVFGGTQEYRTVGQPGGPGAGRSFTCGHCAMAFAIASGAAWYSINPATALIFLASGIVYGIVMGIARIAQGGHFPTDVLWSGVIVLIVLTAVYYFILGMPREDRSHTPGNTRI